MAEKWTIVEKPFEREIVREVEYGIFAKNGKELVANVTSRKDAKLIAVVPQMLEALEALTAVIRWSVVTPILTDKDMVQKAIDQANAVLEAAKGE